MCGRFTLSHKIQEVLEVFNLDTHLEFTPSYNIAPSQSVVVVRAVDGKHEALTMRWGLIPFWMKSFPKSKPMINARAETIREKPAFRAAYRKRRCLIPSDGFYEWKKLETGKQPYYIHTKDHQIFAFAGLWEHWENEQQSIDSCTIITTHANQDMSSIHDRMPVIIPVDKYTTWLSGNNSASLLVPAEEGYFHSYAVDRFVNSPAHNSEKCITAVNID